MYTFRDLCGGMSVGRMQPVSFENSAKLSRKEDGGCGSLSSSPICSSAFSPPPPALSLSSFIFFSYPPGAHVLSESWMGYLS